MSTTRTIPTAIPGLDYGEPPRDKEPRRTRSRSLRSVANLVLGKQATKTLPHEINPPASTSRWPSISTLRRSQKTTLPPPFQVPSSAGDESANSDLYTRDRRSADMPRRRFSLSRPIRLSLNLARPAKRGVLVAESLEQEVAEAHGEPRQDMDAYGEARHGMDAYTHSHDLRRRLEELEVDRASTQVLAGDASSRAAGSVELSLLEGDGGEASSLEVDGVGPALLGSDCVEPSLDAEPGQVEEPSPDATDPLLVQARASLGNIDAAVPTDDGKPVHATAFEVDSEQVNSEQVNSEQVNSEQVNGAKGYLAQPTSPHVAFAEDVVEYGPGLLDLVHLCYEDGDSSDVYPDIDEEACYGDEDGYHGDEDGVYLGVEDGYHDLDDGYHGDDELLYSSDDEDVYAYPPNAMFDVSSTALNHASTGLSAVAYGKVYAPTYESPLASATRIPAGVPFTSRTPVVPFTSRTPAVPFTSRTPAVVLPPAIPHVSDDAYEIHDDAYETHDYAYETHAPQYAAFFSESPSSYDVAMDFLPLSDLEGTPVDEAGAVFGVGAVYGDVQDSENMEGSANDGQADLIFPDEVSFPIEPVIYETREAQKGVSRAWKEEERKLWDGGLSIAPSLETPLLETPLLGPLLNEERGIWRDDEERGTWRDGEATPLPPLQMDRLPWLDGSDEEESPLSPMDGEDSLLSPPSFGAELPTCTAGSLFLAADDEDFSMESEDPVAGDDQNLSEDDNADFALFPTDPRSLPYLLRLSTEYDGTPASELNASPFPTPLPRSPFDENVLPFASLSAQEIATGHQLVRRGRAGVVARRVMVEHQPSPARVDMTAQVESTTQVESMAQFDLTASSPLAAFLPRIRTPAFAPDLLDFFPPPSPFGEMSDGLRFSDSRALVRRPTEGEMAVVKAESSANSSLLEAPSTFSALFDEAYLSTSSTELPPDRPRRPTLTAMQSALLPRVEPLVLDVRDANGMAVPPQFRPLDREHRMIMSNESTPFVTRYPADIVLRRPVAALALDTPQLAMLYSPQDAAVLYSPSSLGAVPSPSYFAALRSPIGSNGTDIDPFELAVAVRAPRELAAVIKDMAEGANDMANIAEPALPFTAFFPDDYVLPDDVDDEPLPFPGLPSWELAVQMQALYIEPKLPRALEVMLGGDPLSDDAQTSTAAKSATYRLPSVPSTLESMVLGTAKASLVSVQPRSLISSLVGLGSGTSPATTPASTSEGTIDLAEKLAVDARDIVFIDAESEDPLAPSASGAQDRASADDNAGKMQQALGKTAASPLGELPLPDMDFASTMVSAVEGLWNGA